MKEADFRSLLDGLVRKFGTREAVGRLIGISGSRVGRALTGEYSAFNVENCLKLADKTGESASVILRAAGKGTIADLIERLYGTAVAPAISEKERRHLDDWKALPAEEQAELGKVIARYVANHRALKDTARTRKRSGLASRAPVIHDAPRT